MRTITIDDSIAGKRLDEALTLLRAESSRTKVKLLFSSSGGVLVNGEKEKPHYRVEAGDVIQFGELPKKETTIKAEELPLDIVYEDDDILVINKPAGLVVHPGNGHPDGTLVNALLHHCKSLANSKDDVRPGIVHRIDKDTSGLLVCAKNDDSYAYLASQLSDHSMHREYVALAQGIILEDDGKIDAPIGRDPKNPLKNTIDLNKGKEAVTYFHVEKRFRESGVTLLRCRLLTGRTHQIRVHLEYIGHPVVGDPLYGENNRKIYSNGQLLHAYRLTLKHPRTKEEMSFEAPIPTFFEDIIRSLR